MATRKPMVEASALAEQMGDLPTAVDRLRLVGLDHASRVQQARLGAATRRLILTRARRAGDTAEIARLEAAMTAEARAQRSYQIAVQTSEIEVPGRASGALILHGRVFDDKGAPAEKLTVAAVGADGQVRRFTCTDAKGYFRMDLPLSTGDAGSGQAVFLQVSDADQAVVYRGDEAIPLSDGGVAYRVIRLSGDRLPPCPLPPDHATMPRLLDQPEAAAIAMLGRLGLKVSQRLTQRAPERAGLVISQTPAAGTPITADTAVTLVIGTAGEGDTVVVPDVAGLSRDEAEAKLKEAGLAVGQLSETPGIPVGTVLKQDPAAGVRVAPGTAIALLVAVQPPEDRVEVPGLVGRSQAEAVEILQKLGLAPGRVTLRDDPRAGIVLAVDPAAGTPVPKGSAVDLVIGRKPDVERTTVPNIVGRSLTGGKEILGSARLQLGAVEGPETGQITAQKPAAGTAISVGSAISVILSADKPQVPTGDFVNQLADLIFADAGFQPLGITMQMLRDRLIAARVSDAESAKRIVDLSDPEVQETFGLQNRNHARSFRRMLRESLERL